MHDQKTQLEINKLLNEGAEQRSQQAQAKDNALYNTGSLLGEVGNIQDKFGEPTNPLIPDFKTGFFGSIMGNIPGSEASDIRQSVSHASK